MKIHKGLLLYWAISRFHKVIYPVLPLRLIQDLENSITPATRIFEYGAGYSTIYFSRKCEIHSVEDDEYWFRKINAKVPGLQFCPGKEDFIHAIDLVKGEFDILYLDGSHRMECLQHAENRVKKGLIILDDANREENQFTWWLDRKYNYKIYGGLRMNSNGVNSKGYREVNMTKVWEIK